MSNTELKNFKEELKLYLRDYLEHKGIYPNKNGFYTCIFPDHEDKTPSMHIYPGSDNKILHCFGCNRNLDIFGAAHILDGYPRHGPEFVTVTLKKLAELFGLPTNLLEQFKGTSEQELEDIYDAYADAYTIVMEWAM
ncbi:MAG: CHC2 zinc finger domain-containing protein, partial [Candidatus Helarchaeota archaeon]